VWTFYKDEKGQVYANIRYAKNYLENPHMPGPNNGINVTFEKGMLVRYGQERMH